VSGFLGPPSADFAARQIMAEKEMGDEKCYRYFNVERRFFVPLWAERVIGKRLAFPINNVFGRSTVRGMSSQGRQATPPRRRLTEDMSHVGLSY